MSSKQEKTKEIDNYTFPNRHDSIYTNIENVEDFEFTHSIVYEFARRNENVQNILNFLNDLFAIYEGIIHKMLDTLFPFMNATGSEDYGFKCNNSYLLPLRSEKRQSRMLTI